MNYSLSQYIDVIENINTLINDHEKSSFDFGTVTVLHHGDMYFEIKQILDIGLIISNDGFIQVSNKKIILYKTIHQGYYVTNPTFIKHAIVYKTNLDIEYTSFNDFPVTNLNDWNEDCDLYFKMKYGDLL